MFLTDQINLSDLSRGSRGPFVQNYFQINPVFFDKDMFLCFRIRASRGCGEVACMQTRLSRIVASRL